MRSEWRGAPRTVSPPAGGQTADKNMLNLYCVQQQKNACSTQPILRQHNAIQIQYVSFKFNVFQLVIYSRGVDRFEEHGGDPQKNG